MNMNLDRRHGRRGRPGVALDRRRPQVYISAPPTPHVRGPSISGARGPRVKHVVVTSTASRPGRGFRLGNLIPLKRSSLLADAIKASHHNESVPKLFEDGRLPLRGRALADCSIRRSGRQFRC